MVTAKRLATLLDEKSLATTLLLPNPIEEVEWVSSTELAHPLPFLEPQTLLLTNGLFASDEGAWKIFVNEAKDAGVCCLGIGLGINTDETPLALIDACEEAEMNLLELPGHVSFVSVSRVVIKFLQDKDLRRDDFPAELLMQQQLSRAAVSGSRMAILRSLANVLNATVSIHGVHGGIVLGPMGAGEESYLNIHANEAVVDLVTRGNRGSISIVDQDHRLTLLPLGLSGKPIAYLGVLSEHPFSEWERSTLNLAMSLLSMEAQSRRAEASSLNKAHRVAVEMLVDGQIKAARAVAREFNLWFPRTAVQAYLIRGPIHLDQIPGPVLRARVGKSTLVLADEDLASNIVSALPDGTVVGIGEPNELRKTYTSVAQAKQAAKTASPGTPVVTWRDARVNSIAGCFNPKLAEQFVRHQLGLVMEDEVLLKTLEAYLVANGSATLASSALNIHRNTLSYRLRQLRQRLGNIDDPSVRANLWVALEMRA